MNKHELDSYEKHINRMEEILKELQKINFDEISDEEILSDEYMQLDRTLEKLIVGEKELIEKYEKILKDRKK